MLKGVHLAVFGPVTPSPLATELPAASTAGLKATLRKLIGWAAAAWLQSLRERPSVSEVDRRGKPVTDP